MGIIKDISHHRFLTQGTHSANQIGTWLPADGTAADRFERRLTAILAADVVGYSRLMGADEEGTLARLKAHRRDLIDPKIAAHRGRLVRTRGDGALIEFQSIVDAVCCAIEIQRGMADRNSSAPQDRRIELRIGINVGDIISDDGDIHGDGVNIAARLESICEPGSIFISDVAHSHVRGKVDVEFADIGDQTLKNIQTPVRVYRVRRDGETALPTTPTPPDKPSIAVLPFHNISGDPDQEYFADGMSEDIITALSKLRWFFVIARNSTFAYKGKRLDVRAVARELGVRYVLEGSVRKAGNRLRITAQLVDATSGNHIWAERYDRKVTNIFAVQDEITQRVVAAVEPQLYAAENLRTHSKAPESLDAWGCVIRALWHLARITNEDCEQARRLLKRAIALSPGYAKAHSLLAWAEIDTGRDGGSDLDTALSVASRLARAALAMDDNDPWTHFAVGYVEFFESRYKESAAAHRRAIELNPNFAMAHGFMGGALAYDGQADAALHTVEQAMRMSPYDPFNPYFLAFAAVAHYTAERYSDALDCAQRVLRQRPNLFPMRRLLAASCVAVGRFDEARETISELLRLRPDASIKRDVYGYVVHAQHQVQERYAAALRKAGLPEE